MSTPDPAAPREPPTVSILSQAAYLIVSIHTALDDSQLVRLQHDLMEEVGVRRARGIVIDVAALDVLDSFATRTLSFMARAAQLKGAETVVVGIAPDVAIAMVQLSLQLRYARTALDLEEGLELLDALTGTGSRPERPLARG
jgi:rsbT antagonist protein RsbS